MSDAACLSEPAASPHQRARGDLAVAFKQRDGETVLDTLRQFGCMKARFPRPERGAWRSAVTLNTAGGIAGGDRTDCAIAVGVGTRATVASQAAERCYRALPGSPDARARVRLRVEAGAALEWLPQETILFDACALDRRTEIALAADAWFLGVEMVVFGRAAMGERVVHGRFRDTVAIRRAGDLLLHDAIRMPDVIGSALARGAVAAGGAAVGTIWHAAPDAARMLEPVRDALAGAPCACGASAWDGLLVVRFVAENGALLRAGVVAGLAALRDGRPPPRVWLC
jgi:urease accessory protein